MSDNADDVLARLTRIEQKIDQLCAAVGKFDYAFELVKTEWESAAPQLAEILHRPAGE